MPWLVITLRLLHILGGVFWVGGHLAFSGFVAPTAAALGPQGVPFLQRFAGKSGYPLAMAIAATITVLAGFALLWHDSGGFQSDWMAGGMGATLSLGALFGLGGAFVGILVLYRSAVRLAAIGRAVQEQGGGPSPEQLAVLQALQGRLRRGGQVNVFLLVAAAICMAVARYVAF